MPASLANPVQDGRTGAGPSPTRWASRSPRPRRPRSAPCASTRAPARPARTSAASGPPAAPRSPRSPSPARPRRAGRPSSSPSPVRITAGQTYVISVNRNTFYPFTAGGLADADHRRARSRTIVGSNGVYGQSSGTFPTNSWNNSNYFVDLQVAATEIEPTSPPTVSATTPADGAVNVAIDVAPTADLLAADGRRDPQHVHGDGAPRGRLPRGRGGDVRLANNRVTIDPVADLVPSIDYTALISTDATSDIGVALAAPVSWSFTTSAAPGHQPAVPRHHHADHRRQLRPGRPDRRRARSATRPASRSRRPSAPRSARCASTRAPARPARTSAASGARPARSSPRSPSPARPPRAGRPRARDAGRAHRRARPTSSPSTATTFYPVTPAGLASQITAGPVRTIVGGNGVYGDAAGTFPTTSWNNSSYLVDLVVAADRGAAAAEPPRR